MTPDVTISLINHSNPALLQACLRSLFATTHHCTLDVWVVDNATDGTGVAEMQAEFPEVHWLFNTRRLGFSANHNQVLRQSTGRYACILNDDIIVHEGAFDQLVAHLDAHPELGMVGARLLNPDGSAQPCTFRFLTLCSEMVGICFLPKSLCGWKSWGIDPAYTRPESAQVDWVLGACLIVRASALKEIGLLDADLSPIANTEEVDWCRRAHQCGWQVGYCPEAVLTHLGGQSVWSSQRGVDPMRVEMHRTRLALFRKHYGPVQAGLLRLVYCLTLPWNVLMLAQAALRRTMPRHECRRHLATLTAIARMSLCFRRIADVTQTFGWLVKPPPSRAGLGGLRPIGLRPKRQISPAVFFRLNYSFARRAVGASPPRPAVHGGSVIREDRMTPPKISIVVLTYNESSRLRPCLESAAWADELIVVDGGSTDGTLEIARAVTPHVHISTLLGPDMPGGFSDQRNFALTLATGDWVLFLDADERVSPELATEIRRRLTTCPDEGHAAYRVRRREHFFGVYTPYTHGQAWQTRLVRRGSGRFDGRLVHEGLSWKGTLGDLSGFLWHYSKDTVAHYVATMNNYTSLEAEELVKHRAPLPRTPWPGMIRAFCYRYFHLGSYREGTFGLLMSLMFAFYHYLTWTKHWELCKNAGVVPGENRPGAVTAAVGGSLRWLWHGAGAVKRLRRQHI